jgi:hypothetical protein
VIALLISNNSFLTSIDISRNSLVESKALTHTVHLDVGEAITFEGKQYKVTKANGPEGGSFSCAILDGIESIAKAIRSTASLTSVRVHSEIFGVPW